MELRWWRGHWRLVIGSWVWAGSRMLCATGQPQTANCQSLLTMQLLKCRLPSASGRMPGRQNRKAHRSAAVSRGHGNVAVGSSGLARRRWATGRGGTIRLWCGWGRWQSADAQERVRCATKDGLSRMVGGWRSGVAAGIPLWRQRNRVGLPIPSRQSPIPNR